MRTMRQMSEYDDEEDEAAEKEKKETEEAEGEIKDDEESDEDDYVGLNWYGCYDQQAQVFDSEVSTADKAAFQCRGCCC